MNDRSQDRWIVQQNIARLKRWMTTDPDQTRLVKFKKLLEKEVRELATFDLERRLASSSANSDKV